MEDKNKRLLRYLNDSYAAEVGGIMALKDLAILAAAQEPALQGVVEEHIRVTQYQAERLKNRILALGGDKSEPKAIVNSAIAKGSSFVNIFHDKEDKLTQDLIKAYSFEHFEIGTYTSLATYAESIGDTETARLAMQIRDEERTAAEQLERFIPICARKAIYRTTEFNHSNHRAESGNAILGIPTSLLLIPGALLAVWGLSKLLEGGSNRDRGYDNGPRPMNPPAYDSGAYSRRDVTTSTSPATYNGGGGGGNYTAAPTTTAPIVGTTTYGSSTTTLGSGSSSSSSGTTNNVGSTYGVAVSEPSGEDSAGMGTSGGSSRVIVVE